MSDLAVIIVAVVCVFWTAYLMTEPKPDNKREMFLRIGLYITTIFLFLYCIDHKLDYDLTFLERFENK